MFKEAEAGDAVAREIIDNALNYLGIGVANAIATFDPEVVIIGGSRIVAMSFCEPRSW